MTSYSVAVDGFHLVVHTFFEKRTGEQMFLTWRKEA